MKVKQINAKQSEFTLEPGDTFRHEIGAADWTGRLLLAAHFIRVAWLILRRGRVTHKIESGRPVDALEDILDAEVIGED